MSQRKKIRLAYLEESERNTVGWAWDAYEPNGKAYYITSRRGWLIVSSDGELVVEERFGEEYDSVLFKDELLKIGGHLFDASLLESAPLRCTCNFAYEKDSAPE